MSARDDLDEVYFDVVRSVRYHDRRRGFFDAMNKLAKFIALGTSAGAFITILENTGNKQLALWFAAGAALISIIELIVDTSNKYALYTDLKNRFSLLCVDIKNTPHPSDADVAQFRAAYSRIEEAEPPVKDVLNCKSYNDAVDATGFQNRYKVKIGWLQSLMAQFFSFRKSSITQQL